MAMNEELLASIDDRLMQVVEKLDSLAKAILPALASRASVAPTTPLLGAATDNAPHYGKPIAAASVPDVDKASRGESTTRRLGLSPEKKSNQWFNAVGEGHGFTS